MDAPTKLGRNGIAGTKRYTVARNVVLRITNRPSAAIVFGKKTKIDPPTKALLSRAIPAVRHDCCVLCGGQIFVFVKSEAPRTNFFSFRRDRYAFAGGSSGRDFNPLF